MNEFEVGIYVRVSTEDQKEYGYSIPQQIDVLTKLAKNNNWHVFKVYNDAGISGKNTEDRPMLQELIKDVKDKKISKVLITKLDRLSRSVVDTDTLLNIFNNFNCELIDSSGKVIESDNPGGWLFTIMQSVFGQYERQTITSRIKDGFAGKIKQGKTLCSATPPYGYNREKGSSVLAINIYESFIVKRIYNMYLDNYTFSEIAKILNSERVETKLNGRIITKKDQNRNLTKKSIIGRWLPKTIKLILSNPTYIGKVRYHINKNDYQEYDGLHTPIVNFEIYNKVQKKINKIKKVFKTNRPKEDVYYCGKLICGVCNRKLTTQRTNKSSKNKKNVYFSYRCINREKGICNAKGVSHKKVEESFLKYIDGIDDLTKINYSEDVIIDNDDVKEIENLKKGLENIKLKKEEIINLLIDNKFNYNDIKYMYKKLNEREKILNQRLFNLKNNLKKTLKLDMRKMPINIRENWLHLTNRERLSFFNEFVEYIIIINKSKDKLNGKVEILEVKFYK